MNVSSVALPHAKASQLRCCCRRLVTAALPKSKLIDMYTFCCIQWKEQPMTLLWQAKKVSNVPNPKSSANDEAIEKKPLK
jgi:hypothetical protein